MALEDLSKEELIQRVKELNEYMENVIVFWGGRKELRETFDEVARNESGEYTDQEVQNAAILKGSQGAFDEFVELIKDSFDRGGINFAIREKMSTLMEEAASRYTGQQ